MRNFNNLIGMKFGAWEVIDFDKEKSKETKRSHWICKCDCGTIRSVIAKDLLNGKSTSCGCLRSKATSKSIFKDLTGQKFGRLTVLRMDDEKSTPKEKYWICQCECGNVNSISGRSLKSGYSKSCGCLRKELNTRRNNYEIYGDFGKCYFENSEDYFLFDTRDLDIVESYAWRICNGYVRGHAIDENGNESDVMFHRLVIEKYYDNLDNDYQVDHIDHNTLDNRFNNIRPCNRLQNQLNRSSKQSNTGVRNISYISTNNSYHVNIEGISKSFSKFDDAKAFKDKYIDDHPNDFRYDKSKVKTNDSYIQPFVIVDEKKFNNGLEG